MRPWTIKTNFTKIFVFFTFNFWDFLATTNYTDCLKHLWFLTGMFVQMKWSFQQEGPCTKDVSCLNFFFISFLKWKKVTYINDVYNLPYYSFKIFPGSWLVKTTCIIHHNQLLLIKFRKNFVILNGWRQNDIKSAAWLQVIEALTKKTWGQGWVVLVVRTKWRNCHGTFHSFQGKILSKNIVRTARRQLNRQYLLFGVYLQTRADLNLVNFPIKMHYRYELTSTEVSMF